MAEFLKLLQEYECKDKKAGKDGIIDIPIIDASVIVMEQTIITSDLNV